MILYPSRHFNAFWAINLFSFTVKCHTATEQCTTEVLRPIMGPRLDCAKHYTNVHPRIALIHPASSSPYAPSLTPKSMQSNMHLVRKALGSLLFRRNQSPQMNFAFVEGGEEGDKRKQDWENIKWVARVLQKTKLISYNVLEAAEESYFA